MRKTTSEKAESGDLPIHRFHPRDSAPRQPIDPASASAAALRKQLKIEIGAAKEILRLHRRGVNWSSIRLPRTAGLPERVLEAIARRGLRADGARLVIADVLPESGRIMSGCAFTLLVDLRAAPGTEPVLVCATVHWAGEPFVVEQAIAPEHAQAGRVPVHFDSDQSLPAGPAVFSIAVFGADGSQSSFRVSAAVLPSNPLSLTMSPSTNFLTGVGGARGVKESGDVYRTRVRVSIYNGDAAPVTIRDTMTWKFWDGGVGGTLVESGTTDWGSDFTIAAHSAWSGTITFTSPNGSGIYGRYAGKEDMTMEFSFDATDGRTIRDMLTTRVMVGFGMNVTRAGDSSWTSQEYEDLYAAVDVTQQIYEAQNITYMGISRRHIADGSVGGYTIIDSEAEARDLFEAWSGPDNAMIDVFIVHDHTTGNDGMAGDIPGPTSHAGRKSGVWASKTGYIDGDGKKRLRIDYLGMLIAHEVGHYLGLVHSDLAGNLMLSNSGADDVTITYDQYRAMLDFGWMFVA